MSSCESAVKAPLHATSSDWMLGLSGDIEIVGRCSHSFIDMDMHM